LGAENIGPHFIKLIMENLELEKALENTPLKDRADISKGEMNDFLGRLVENFNIERIKEFPSLCEETRRINIAQQQFYDQVGHKTSTKYIGGKVYEGTSGWSKDKTFQHKWVVPNKLMFFMRNLIYVKFWEDENKKVRDSFMKAVLRGDDSYELLRKVRDYYGPNSS